MMDKKYLVTLLFFAAYLISSYFTFWVETSWRIYGFLLFPVVILSSVVLFGANLKGKLNIVIRLVSAIVLSAGLWFGLSGACCPGEQGAIGLLYIGQAALFLVFLAYLILWLIQRFKKA